MPKVRQNGAARWATRTAAATEDYKAGIANPRVQWQQATVAAAGAHKAAMTEALNQDRFAKGVAKTSNEKWASAAQGKGADRFGQGAAAGVQDYATAVAPYLQVIEGTQLPPRGPKGDPRNLERVRVLTQALRKRKTGFSLLSLMVMVASVMLLLTLGGSWLTHRASIRPYGVDGFQNANHRQEGKSTARRLLMPGMLSGMMLFAILGAAIDTVSFSATAPGAGGAAAAAVAGDSAAVRNVSFDQKPYVLQMWVKSQVSGFAQFTHPSGHDQVRDIRVRHNAATPLPMFLTAAPEPAEPQENITVTIGGSAVAGQFEMMHLLMYYPTLPGIDGRFIDTSALDSRLVKLVTIEDTTTATAGAAYSGARALNAASDLLIANTDYAILGAHIQTVCGALTVRGTDTGNLRVGIPGMPARPDITADWFPFLSDQFGVPCIPVINSANKAAIFIENITDQALAAVPFSLLLAQLSPG